MCFFVCMCVCVCACVYECVCVYACVCVIQQVLKQLQTLLWLLCRRRLVRLTDAITLSCFQAMEEDMEMRQAALDSVKIAAEELLKQAGNDQDEAVRGKHAQMLICCFCCANTK